MVTKKSLSALKMAYISLGAVLSICVVPYLIPDAIKIVLACLISERLRAALHL